MASSDYLLQLVRQALDDFDDKPLDVSVRRAVRIANLVGDTRHAIRLSLELRPPGGSRRSNGEISRMLMEDPSTWGSGTGPAEEALAQYIDDRKFTTDGDKDLVVAHSLAEIDFWEAELRELKESGERFDYRDDLASRERNGRIVAKTRHLTFALLCSWERRFGYSGINESIFGGYRAKVDKLLADGVPELLQQFSAVYRRLQEAAETSPDRDVAEELSQAITTCRRILKAVVDHVLPPQDQPSTTGHLLDDAHHRNRLFEFTKQAIESKSNNKLTDVMITGLYERFVAVDTMTNKAVHAAMAFETANLCALNTYIICGEIISLHALQGDASDVG
ncbi:hypothetical protein J8N05_18635 [Streptomyces sp. BH-SS-21]|uniref:Uncharacterized protein n=1 Tax=Streptomyces liliiviolaceus TaxID=2823109 RepID=A0A940Y0S1_9ACTN|nr:hypothetical protein [Streptomyces liliiviolaceus]MBQ0850215.1 hypothetical protein [Streptomyces liliiviolaceus]